MKNKKIAIILPTTLKIASYEDLKKLATLEKDESLNYGLFMTVDEDDNYDKDKLASIFLRAKEIFVKKYPIKKPAQICKMWREAAYDAYKRGYDFFLLLGDDIEITGNWYQEVVDLFNNISKKNKVPFSVGCVVLKDVTSPNFPTFPIVGRKHIELFEEIFPIEFVNQDADPFLYELYRRVESVEWTKNSYLINKRGGVTCGLSKINKPVYEQIHIEWQNKLLKNALYKLKRKYNRLPSALTIDIVIPCFRIDKKCLDRILSIREDSRVSHRFIIIIDRNIKDIEQEKISYLQNLEKLHSVRVRINENNEGASFSRNRGMKESHSDWILYLDDDVYPQENIISAYASAILANPEKDGFVGKSILPKGSKNSEVERKIFNEQTNFFTTSTEAVHMAQISFFWTIADHFQNVPWGVTANLLVKKNDEIGFDLDFPKTGGGEDIDFCLKLAKWPLIAVPEAVVIHPWWSQGKRLAMWKRFYKWANGDGLLINKYPHYTLRTLPNIWEWTIILVSLILIWGREPLKYLLVLWSAEFASGTIWSYFHKDNCPHLQGFKRLLVSLEANFPRNASELGHIVRHISDGRLDNLTKRFDWFCGLYQESIQYERNRASFHNTGFLGAALLFWMLGKLKIINSS